MRLALGLLALACLWPALPSTSSPTRTDSMAGAPDRVQPNDNRKAAGRLRNGVLRIALEVRLGRWFPEAEHGDSILLPVLSEVGKAPSIPGPLIRVPTGTIVEATITNRLADSTITVHGFVTRPATVRDTTAIPPGETRSVRFEVGAEGTYLYRAIVGDSEGEQQQLAGAFIVDPPGRVEPDRIFVINIWGALTDSVTYRNALAINGKGWPNTERLVLDAGKPVRWRVVNASVRQHPMHLHGFYFDVLSSGTISGDTIYPPERHRTVVTEDLRAGRTMTMAWTPDRPGNWLFHCHISFHVIPEEARYAAGDHVTHDHEHMAGLVLGIEVREPRGWKPPARPDPDRQRMVIEERPRGADSVRAIGIAIGAAGREQAGGRLGPLLLAERGRPLDVTVVNRLGESTAIHWHGLELESFWDGVAGWSGTRARVAPPVLARDSFVAHLTVPRAGTFMYHTHLNDLSQITGGLYGPLVVLEPGERWDPAREHLFTIGWHGLRDSTPPFIINGDSTEAPLELAAGVPHRLRFINIGVGGRVLMEMKRDTVMGRWRLIAVDGADLPPHAVEEGPAWRLFNVGMTFDALFTPEPGTYELGAIRDGRRFYRRTIIAR